MHRSLATADLSEALPAGWTTLSAAELARRPVFVAAGNAASLGDLFDLAGTPAGSIRFEGDLSNASRIGAGLAEGDVVIEGNVGREVGLGMSGGSIVVTGNAGRSGRRRATRRAAG